MENKQKQPGNFALKQNEILFAEGQDTQSISILLQGKIEVFISPYGYLPHQEQFAQMSEEELLKKSYKVFTLDPNIFVGVGDLFLAQKHSCSYRALEDSTLYRFPMKDIHELQKLMDSKKEYGAYMLGAITTLIELSCSAYKKVAHFARLLSILTDNLAVLYWSLKEKSGFSCSATDDFFQQGYENLQKIKNAGLSPSLDQIVDFIERDHSEVFESEYGPLTAQNTDKADYYKHLSGIPAEIRKSFFSADMLVAFRHCEDASAFLETIQTDIREAFQTASSYFGRLYCDGEECLFARYIQAAKEIKRYGSDPSAILQVLDYIADKIREFASFYESEYSHVLPLDPDYIDHMLQMVKQVSLQSSGGDALSSEGSIQVLNTDCIPEELQESAEKILQYADIPKERAEIFRTNLEKFRGLRDKFTLDGDARNIRKAVTSVFFEIYEAVFKKVREEKNPSRLYHMFLTYAYMDEKLLHPEHVLALYKLAGEHSSGSSYRTSMTDPANSSCPVNGSCLVDTMEEWLTRIQTMEKDPSINEYGQDYYDVFREMKKRREVTDQDKAAYEEDGNGRVSHEIGNLFRINQKLCYGQISVYFPILFNDMISKDLSKALVTADKVNEGIRRILDVDFSAFHREISYRNPEKGIEKEFIMKAILPDFILIPTYGSRGVMWQELTGRARNTPGRLLLPLFTRENLDDLLVKLVGNFRWELCRTMMGAAWIDITQKSLTSEYNDYIQFYKKNRDLPEEVRGKITFQIQKHRNILRDIFTSDYETWLRYEAKGMSRLNRVAKGILYRHCPFPREIREQLEKQPMYREVAAQFKNTRIKHARELENHYHSKFDKAGITLDPDMEENLRFYKEL